MTELKTTEYKKTVIDEVQKRIDSWIGRDYYFGHEATWLKFHNYPYRINRVIGIPMLFEQYIKYTDLFTLVRKGVFEEDVKFLFEDAMDNYLCHVFGG